VAASDSLCGDWQTYREEKCIKIIDEEKLVTFEDANKSCSQIDNSSGLITIHSKEEQDFISEYLFKTHKLVDNVWIGLRNISKTFEWTDTSNIQYTNWRTGNPTNKPDFNCVQLESDSLQWADEPCHRKGLVVCQKLPQITFSDLLKRFIETKEKLIKTEDDLKKTEKELKETQYKLNYVLEHKNVSHFHAFNDENGKSKAFVIPTSAMTKQHTFDDSVSLCKSFNSTLIEIESKEKQIILESFLHRSGVATYPFLWFWINGERDSSGRWKWLKSGKEFTFTNWITGYPDSKSDTSSAYSDRNNLYACTSASVFGKWGNNPKNYTFYALCEHTFEF